MPLVTITLVRDITPEQYKEEVGRLDDYAGSLAMQLDQMIDGTYTSGNDFTQSTVEVEE